MRLNTVGQLELECCLIFELSIKSVKKHIFAHDDKKIASASGIWGPSPTPFTHYSHGPRSTDDYQYSGILHEGHRVYLSLVALLFACISFPSGTATSATRCSD